MSRHITYYILYVILFFSVQCLWGQAPIVTDSDLVSIMDTSIEASEVRPVPLKRLTVFGYLRTLGYARNMTEAYPNLAPYEKAYGIGDGYREPMLSLNVTARPNGKTTFGTELFFFTPYLGTQTIDYVTQPPDNAFTMNLGINLYGNFRTKYGKFGVRTGGIHWYNLSSFTMGTYQVLDRYSIFERTPWEGVAHTDKYENYYESGAINRGDTRWANRAFQGLIVDGGALPGGFSFAFLYGKTQPNGGLTGNQDNPFATIINPDIFGNVPTYAGFSGTGRVMPNLAAGGRLTKNFKGGAVSYNTLNSWTYLDSLTDEKRTYQVHTLAFNLKVDKLSISGEMGAGAFSTPDIDQKWGEAIKLKVQSPKEYTFLPVSLEFYQISANYYNENGEILTFSNPKIQNSGAALQNSGQASAGGPLTLVGQLSHNRRGINLNTEKKLGPLTINVGLAIAKELDTLSTEISYDHRINGLAMTRIYNPFPANATGPTIVGPYGRVTTYFRGAFETVKTTDVDPATAGSKYRKVFNAVDIQAKYKAEIPDHPLYLFYLASFQSARRDLGILPTFQEDTYVFAQYHELDLYFELFPQFILTGYGGLEVIKGGINTEIDAESLLPRNQLGRAIGVGFDWTIAKNAGIYVRQRFMNFEDRNFSLDRYKGRETTIELKIYF